ncbi:branched-chain amino acid transport system substrate-binding protein [Roseomonas rosea]|uniref:Branched-chain amino acid transport system substrate-binding protein n=1 Tax=Muricoccus roseus TaxID=198092 RepID=A0A1M6CZX4_9PROT|nr:ABC transporter substrate-binding protein [Roseomonas rosea]SHI66374.1 branched-chain amino acid transport system substrate-binding protein [Roseomonas rosea]
MTGSTPLLPRRTALLAGMTALAAPAVSRAQGTSAGAPLRLGILTPLTGAGGFDGPRMLKAMQAVGEEINAAGGLLGRRIEFAVEDDQTNPEGAVRAARKLIDVDKVPVIMGTWASAVTAAVAPVCWESKTFLTTVSGADSITQLPHQGYLIRTQPNNHLQAGKHAEFIAGTGAKKVFVMSLQSPFAMPTQNRVREVLAQKGAQMTGALLYEKDKTSYRSEVDQALRTRPDLIYLNGYTPDVTILLRELYRAGFEGPRFAQSYSVTDKALESLPREVTEKVYTVQPSSDVDSPAFEAAKKRLGTGVDSYEAQATDWISLVALTIAKGREATGTALRENVRKIAQGEGTKVYTAVEGLRLLGEGKEINYEGASGPCDFTEIGDIVDCKFRYQIVENGAFRFLKVA